MSRRRQAGVPLWLLAALIIVALVFAFVERDTIATVITGIGQAVGSTQVGA